MKYRKFSALLLMAALLLCLCACSSAQADTPSPEPEAAAPAPELTPVPAAVPEPEPAAESEPPAAPESESAPEPEAVPEQPGEDAKAAALELVGAEVSELYDAVGYPISSSYAPSCLGDGEDGELVYDGFTVYTFKAASGGETVSVVL